jgi:ketosteroid isomerase-like protein
MHSAAGKTRRIASTFAALCLFILLAAPAWAAGGDDRADILKAREAVWRAWFANDAATLKVLVPAETIVFSANDPRWKDQAEILRSAAEFQSGGGKLTRLEFPRTEVQQFGDVAIVWSNYIAETEMNGKKSVDAGRASEIFVRRDGHWVNPGWHTDPAR